jgi:hypothetical protein
VLVAVSVVAAVADLYIQMRHLFYDGARQRTGACAS